MGDFLGHFIAGTFISIFGFWLLLSAILQTVRHRGGEDDDDFLARVFYNKPRLITTAFVCTLIGILVDCPKYHGIEKIIPSPPAKVGVPHVVLYGSYACMLLSILLERKGYLPRTSILWWNAVAHWMAYVLWSYHASTKKGADAIFHNLLADCVLIACLFSILSGLVAAMNHKQQQQLVPTFVIMTLYFTALHGLLLYSIAFYYYDWRKPIAANHHDVQDWEPPCVFAFVVFTSLWGLGMFWNCVKKKGRRIGQQGEEELNHGDNLIVSADIISRTTDSSSSSSDDEHNAILEKEPLHSA